MVRAEAATRQAARPEASVGANPDAVWGVRGIMARDILPEGPTERRRRSKLCALRAVDKLGLLGEGNLLAALADRPRLRWLVDEEGARWAVLAQLGRIGDPWAFEEFVEWALENRPRPEEAGAYVRRLMSSAHRLDEAGPESRRAEYREPTNLRKWAATSRDSESHRKPNSTPTRSPGRHTSWPTRSGSITRPLLASRGPSRLGQIWNSST
jgi:hypothetical protein